MFKVYVEVNGVTVPAWGMVGTLIGLVLMLAGFGNLKEEPII